MRETELDLDLLAQTESIFALANGHLGLRGNLDEGEPRGLSGTYLNGLYESYPLEYGERGFGFAEDGQAVVNVTDGKIIRLLVEDEPFDVHRGHLEHHERTLDFRTGILTREVHGARRRVSPSGCAAAASSRSSIAAWPRSPTRSRRSSARCASRCSPTCTPTRSTGRANGDPRAGRALGDVLDSELHIDHGLRVVLAHRTKRTKLGFAAGMEHVIDAQGEVNTLTQSEPDLGRVTMAVELHPGRPLALTKFLSYHWSSRQTIDWLRDQVDASLESAVAQGFDVLAERQRAFLDDYWEGADIELDGDPEIQQALRFAQFHLAAGVGAGRGPGDRRQGADRPRLRRPRVLGHRGLRAPGADPHDAATRRARRCAGATGRCRSRASAPPSSG